MRYVAEALLRPLLEAEPDNEDAALTAATCEALEATYAEAVQRLSCGRGGGWEGGGAGLSMQSEEDSFEGGDVAWGGTQLGGGAGFDAPGQGGAARTAGAGLLERRPGGFQGGRAGGVPAVAQRCLRETMGSLDEVVGLAAIKQVGAATSLQCNWVLRDPCLCAWLQICGSALHLALPSPAATTAQELREAVLLPMRLPHLFVGIRRPQTNLMFHGAPGTGRRPHCALCH